LSNKKKGLILLLRKCFTACLVYILVIVVVACSRGGGNEQAEPSHAKPKEPVVLTIYGNIPTEAEQQQLFIAPVQAKYPYISFKFIPQDKDNQPANLVASGTNPDLIIAWNGGANVFSDLGLLTDITPDIQKHKIDLNRFEPVYLDAIRVNSEKGELYGLPYKRQFNALYYNKTIFDNFGVAYPKDGMTWSDAIELAKRLTRMEQGVQYRGLDPESPWRLSFPLSIPFVNAKTYEAEIDNDKLRTMFEVGRSIYGIPGNAPGSQPADYWAKNDFYVKQNIALMATTNWVPMFKEATEKGFSWDMAQYPSYEGMPNIYGMVDAHFLMPSSLTKHRDDVINVIEVLTSPEVQLISARNFANASPLKDSSIQKQFAADVSFAKNKHYEAAFKSSPAPGVVFTKFYNDARNQVHNQLVQVVNGQKDVNTALRDAEAAANKIIQAQMAKK
jgi:multiple sugar transport system substrate-binding protein